MEARGARDSSYSYIYYILHVITHIHYIVLLVYITYIRLPGDLYQLIMTRYEMAARGAREPI